MFSKHLLNYLLNVLAVLINERVCKNHFSVHATFAVRAICYTQILIRQVLAHINIVKQANNRPATMNVSSLEHSLRSMIPGSAEDLPF